MTQLIVSITMQNIQKRVATLSAVKLPKAWFQQDNTNCRQFPQLNGLITYSLSSMGSWVKSDYGHQHLYMFAHSISFFEDTDTTLCTFSVQQMAYQRRHLKSCSMAWFTMYAYVPTYWPTHWFSFFNNLLINMHSLWVALLSAHTLYNKVP